jgi:glycosyltransferase involved in cell wall biosynthesis
MGSVGRDAMGKQRVLVVVPVWNAEATLQEALDSVFSQDGVDFDVLAVDDGSQDRSLDILKEQRDSRLLVHPLEHQGLCAIMNHAIQFASARGYEYLVRMDSDDVSKAGRFERLIRYMDANPGCAAVGSNCEYFTSNGKGGGTSTVSVRRRQITFEIRHGLRGLVQGACCFRVAALVAVGGYRIQFKAAEDADLFLRLVDQFELGNVSDYLYRIRVNAGSRSRSNFRRNVLYSHYAMDCARRRKRGQTERSFEEFADWADRFSLSLRLEYWSMSLWEISHKGSWRKVLIPPAALMSPLRVYARVMRALVG